MLQLFVLFGFGLLLAAIYKALADKTDHQTKLERVRRQIALREAEAEAWNTQTKTSPQDLAD